MAEKKTKKYGGQFTLPWRYNKMRKKAPEEWKPENHCGLPFKWKYWSYQPSKFEKTIRNIIDSFKGVPVCIKNFFFCLKYPFWRSRNVWTGKFTGYRWTWYDDIEPGWQKAFGKQLSDDIKAAYQEDKKENPKLKWKDALYWEQIKEKYATLRLYASATACIMKVLNHYEDISEGYCIYCGKPSEYETTGWILPCCSECFDLAVINAKYKKEDPEGYQKYKEKCKFECEKAPEKVIPLYSKSRRDTK